MSTNHLQVVVGFDFSKTAHEALYRAIALATRAPDHVLHFVCVIEPHTANAAVPAKHVDYAYAERVQTAMTDVIVAELKCAAQLGRAHFYVHARIGKPAEEILTLAREVGADLILVGSKGLTGVERLVLGSVAEKVVREAQCTVEVARRKTYNYVELLQIVDAKEEHKKYVPPHRYTYENRTADRSAEWPLY